MCGCVCVCGVLGAPSWERTISASFECRRKVRVMSCDQPAGDGWRGIRAVHTGQPDSVGANNLAEDDAAVAAVPCGQDAAARTGIGPESVEHQGLLRAANRVEPQLRWLAGFGDA